tara:strand:+ start:4156 stop:4380 length:225 start_codon:yes stop_codon:yes gene_type:complete
MSESQRVLEIGKEKQILREKIALNKQRAEICVNNEMLRKADDLLSECLLYHQDIASLNDEENKIYESWGIIRPL